MECHDGCNKVFPTLEVMLSHLKEVHHLNDTDIAIIQYLCSSYEYQSPPCDHEKTKAELRACKGMMLFTYCLTCKCRFEYDGVPYKPQWHKMTFRCERCFNTDSYKIKELELYPETAWICVNCGWERVIIADRIIKARME